MQRVILSPPALPSSALAELKQWLGITTTQDDAPLTALLRAALQTCEAFTGLMPIEAECEEMLPACAGWRSLATRPVTAITALDGVTASGDRFILTTGTYDFELDADGAGRVRLLEAGAATHVAVRFTAGLAPDWDGLPDSLRHGLMRLAAHQHRERESDGAAPLPPASVAALWRPWRRMRLA
ncbi:head-tail connector protein [Novosphingobium album (ex Liu et al. 2023)]|uniref:Phage head-tail connector protein n=1 Tax=Novosphingobium album (ex Liu et al. 2023) TaxID=3031130 RepID=A0ABT5WLA2_9SPHN|nr:phage head-tail connector protein [Novosphingobium album (ex Liu et al. 2023)]MDE8650806.1 phage head-tail connector protein [Novosphingobium album (ex Liu et al. 2023)]